MFYLHQKNEDISLSDLGEELQVSTATANDTIKKSQTEGVIISKNYKPKRIIEKGKQQAAEIIRKHRLFKMFLMKFDWEEVHEIREELEHIKTNKIFNLMDELMGFPKIDPHGSPLTDKTEISINLTTIGFLKFPYNQLV